MFGGLAFRVNTHMACGIVGRDQTVRVGAERYEAALADGAREMDFTGRPMRGMVMVEGGRVQSPEELEGWVRIAAEFALSEPRRRARTVRGR